MPSKYNRALQFWMDDVEMFVMVPRRPGFEPEHGIAIRVCEDTKELCERLEYDKYAV